MPDPHEQRMREIEHNLKIGTAKIEDLRYAVGRMKAAEKTAHGMRIVVDELKKQLIEERRKGRGHGG